MSHFHSYKLQKGYHPSFLVFFFFFPLTVHVLLFAKYCSYDSISHVCRYIEGGFYIKVWVYKNLRVQNTL